MTAVSTKTKASDKVLPEKKRVILHQLVCEFLQGKRSIAETELALVRHCEDTGLSGKKLFQRITYAFGNPGPVDAWKMAVLKTLNISNTDNSEKYDRYRTAQNLNELLKKLKHDGNHQVAALANLIDKTRAPRNSVVFWGFLTVAVGSISLILGLKHNWRATLGRWIGKNVPAIFRWIGRVFSNKQNIPLIGIILSSTALLWSWIKILRNGTTTGQDKVVDAVFDLCTQGLNIAGYVISYIAKGALPGAAAAVFVASSILEWGNAIWRLGKAKMAFNRIQKNYAQQTAKSIESWAEYKRAENALAITKKGFWVEALACVLLSIAVTIWCFASPTLYVTISCFLFMTIASITKGVILDYQRKKGVDQLQRILERGPDADEGVTADIGDKAASSKLDVTSRQFKELSDETQRRLKQKAGMGTSPDPENDKVREQLLEGASGEKRLTNLKRPLAPHEQGMFGKTGTTNLKTNEDDFGQDNKAYTKKR